jgi:hypothetical protein
MITDAVSPAAIASAEAAHSANSQLSALLPDYAIALRPRPGEATLKRLFDDTRTVDSPTRPAAEDSIICKPRAEALAAIPVDR